MTVLYVILIVFLQFLTAVFAKTFYSLPEKILENKLDSITNVVDVLGNDLDHPDSPKLQSILLGDLNWIEHIQNHVDFYGFIRCTVDQFVGNHNTSYPPRHPDLLVPNSTALIPCTKKLIFEEIILRVEDLGSSYVLRDFARSVLTEDLETKLVLSSLAGLGCGALMLEELGKIQRSNTPANLWLIQASRYLAFGVGVGGILFDYYSLLKSTEALIQCSELFQEFNRTLTDRNENFGFYFNGQEGKWEKLRRSIVFAQLDFDDENYLAGDEQQKCSMLSDVLDVIGAFVGMAADLASFYDPFLGSYAAVGEFLYTILSQVFLVAEYMEMEGMKENFSQAWEPANRKRRWR